MNGWQIAMIVWFSLTLLISANEHGKPKKGNNNFWNSFFGCLIMFSILYFGGFFS